MQNLNGQNGANNGLNVIDSTTQIGRENAFYEKLDKEIYSFKE
jgi:hypothetical protein